MSFVEIENAIINGKRMIKPVQNGHSIEPKQGYYSIWVRNPKNLPIAIQKELKIRKTNLLYIGIASKSLLKRLHQQELQHKSAATFFRSLGVILGHSPEKGSLFGKKNQNNYKFNKETTKAISEWNNENVEIAFHYAPAAVSSIEKELITKYRPILNWTHNPDQYIPLRLLKENCRLIARTKG